MKRFVMFALVIALAASGFLLYRRYQSAQAAKDMNYQTVAVKRSSLTATVGATGSVRANQMSILAWQVTGNIATVKAAVDQQVQKGEILAELDRGSLPQEIILAQSDLISAQRELDRLRSSNTASAQAGLTLAEAEKTFDDAQRALNSLANGRASQESIDVVKADLLLAQKQVDQLQEIFDQFSGRPEDDPQRATALSNLSSAKQKRDQIQRNYNWMTGSSSDQEIAEAQARLDLAQAQLEDAQGEWERLKDGADPADIAAAEARITALEASLNLAYLTAPFDGTITDVTIKPGDQATIGLVAFRVDDLSRLLVDVPVSEVDINRIKVGQEALLTFDAISATEYHGKVIQVAKVGTTDQGVVSFKVTVELTDPDEDVRPGMTAAVNVVVANVEDVITVPNRAVRLKDGKRVVYILKNGQPQAVEVTLGSSSEIESEILSDNIKVGDQVILNPPSQFQSGGSSFMGR